MLCTTKTDSLCAEFACFVCIFGSVGICTHVEFAFTYFVGPFKNGPKLFWRFCCFKQKLSEYNFSRCAIKRNNVALFDGDVTDRKSLTFDFYHVSTNNCWSAPTTSNDRGMTNKPTACCQNTLSNHHAVNIFWACLAAHQNDCFTAISCVNSIICREIHFANCCTR